MLKCFGVFEKEEVNIYENIFFKDIETKKSTFSFKMAIHIHTINLHFSNFLILRKMIPILEKD